MTLILLCISALAAGALVVAFAEVPAIALATTLAGFIVTRAGRDPILADGLTFGNYAIHPLDLLTVLLAVATAVRIARARTTSSVHVLLFVLCAMTAIHLGRGVSTYGVQAAFNGARNWLWFVAPLAYALTVTWRRRDLILVVVAALCVAAIGVVGLSHTGLRSVRQPILVDGFWVDPRPVTAAGALLLLQAIVVGVAVRLRPSLWRAFVVSCLASLVVVLQHRTVWLAAAGVLLILALGYVLSTPSMQRERTYAAIGVTLILLPIGVYAVSSSPTLRASAAEIRSSNSTLRWRTDSWRSLLSQHHSPLDLTFGLPAGSSWEREILGGRVTEIAPHSMYVETLLRFGIGGLVLLLGLWLTALRAATRQGPLGISPRAIYALIAAQAVFAFSYPLGSTEGMLLGALLALPLSQRARAEYRLPAATPMEAAIP